MKSVFSFIKRCFYNTAAIYMLTSVFYFVAFFAVDDGNKANYGAIELFMNSLLFGFLASLVFTVFGSLKRLPSFVRYCAELVLTYGAFWFSLFALTENGGNFPAVFAMSTVFAIVYALGAAVVLFFQKLEADEKSAKEYVSVYGSIDKDDESGKCDKNG